MPLRLPHGDPCYFCEIVAGREDQWNVIERSDHCIAVLNGRQYEVGQCIIAVRRHAPTVLDLLPEEQGAVLAMAKRLAEAMVAELDPDGILLYQNNGVGSGQEVPHFHMHVVPRRQGSDWGIGPPHLAKLEAKPANKDHTIVTDAKRQTAGLLRTALQRR